MKTSLKRSKAAKDFIGSPEKQQHLYRRTLLVVVISQIFGGAGLAAGIAVGALLAQDMLGTDRYAGIPSALFTLGSAGAAFLVGRLSQRYGRRLGLSAGFIAGGLGSAGVVAAAVTNSILLLFLSLVIYGSGFATNLLSRYAGTDLANSNQRATAISTVMVSTTFGVIAGPNLIQAMSGLAKLAGIPPLAGPFILSAAAFTLAGLVLFVFLRPDPLLLAKTIGLPKSEPTANGIANSAKQQNKKGLFVGTAVMIISHSVMVGIMAITPVHMGHHGHGLGNVGLLISIHAGSMYLPSLFTGKLVDKAGRSAIAIASGITLLGAGLLAAFAPPESMFLLTTALALLGLGWNFGLVSGTALIVDSTNPETRAKTQGSVDVLISLAGAMAGAGAGLAASQFGYYSLSIAGGILSLLLVPAAIWLRTGSESPLENRATTVSK
ncbi:MFS transporter [Neobacillus piezotolerans]|uniref:MFS transporter n=1 Tax=Neobacillus piezotolerans TaxID=2259171 RepID=A0A3D8GSB0_9BACI|nr:MFS transporter [Neobacillus piezotolerans]RDU37345.1 MFS transporter [Neobacillus piezotolerans]